MNDGYMGSGKIIKKAIEKYGIGNFTKAILETFEDSVSMYNREKEVVTEDFLDRDDVYNLRRGGRGGFDHINKNGLNVDLNKQRLLHPEIFSELGKKNLSSWKEKVGPEIVKEFQRKAGLASAEKGSVFIELNNDPIFQEKRKKKFREIGHQKGEKNSCFGTMWITNGTKNIRIKKIDEVPEGWRKGRVMNSE